MNLDTLKLYQKVRSQMTNVSTKDKEMRGSISYYEGIIDDLKLLYNKDLCSGVYQLMCNGKTIEASLEDAVNKTKLQKCESVNIEIHTQSTQGNHDGFICTSWGDVLKYMSHLTNSIKNIYIADRNEIVGESNETKEYKNYKKIPEVIKLIEKISYKKYGNEHVIVCGQILELEVSVNENDLTHDIDAQLINELSKQNLHQEAMFSLIRKCLFEQLSPINKKNRFSHLLEHFNIFSSNVLVGYSQFVCNYSFDKVRREYQEKTTEYISKINSSFDNVSAKAFSIPAGVWLAAMQITESEIDSFQFIKNVIYLLMVFILDFIVCFNFFGQFAFIDSLKQEYTGLFQRLKDGLDDKQSDEIEALKLNLDTRYKIVYRKLLATIFFVILLFVVTLGLVIYAIK